MIDSTIACAHQQALSAKKDAQQDQAIGQSAAGFERKNSCYMRRP
jgi:hypothetical protein